MSTKLHANPILKEWDGVLTQLKNRYGPDSPRFIHRFNLMRPEEPKPADIDAAVCLSVATKSVATSIQRYGYLDVVRATWEKLRGKPITIDLRVRELGSSRLFRPQDAPVRSLRIDRTAQPARSSPPNRRVEIERMLRKRDKGKHPSGEAPSPSGDGATITLSEEITAAVRQYVEQSGRGVTVSAIQLMVGLVYDRPAKLLSGAYTGSDAVVHEASTVAMHLAQILTNVRVEYLSMCFVCGHERIRAAHATMLRRRWDDPEFDRLVTLMERFLRNLS